MLDVGKKLKASELRFRTSEGVEEDVVLRSLDASVILHTNSSLECARLRNEGQLRLISTKVGCRDEIIKDLIKVNKHYQKKVQELMLYVNLIALFFNT